MSGRPRSRRQVRIVQVKLRLYLGEDDDLIAFFESIPPRLRAVMVKQALRSGAPRSEGGEDEDLFDALDAFILEYVVANNSESIIGSHQLRCAGTKDSPCSPVRRQRPGHIRGNEARTH